jgi:hypothetical protein
MILLGQCCLSYLKPPIRGESKAITLLPPFCRPRPRIRRDKRINHLDK